MMLSKIYTRLRACGRGATSIEYALIASAVAGAIAVVVFTLGGSVAGFFGAASGAFGG